MSCKYASRNEGYNKIASTNANYNKSASSNAGYNKSASSNAVNEKIASSNEANEGYNKSVINNAGYKVVTRGIVRCVLTANKNMYIVHSNVNERHVGAHQCGRVDAVCP